MTRVDLARLSDVASGVPSGTAFPGSPSDGDLFYRTDLGFLCRYHSSATRWMTAHTMRADLFPHRVNIVSTTGTMGLAVLHKDYDAFLTTIEVATFVAAPNSGAAFWTVAANKIDPAGSATSLGSFTTAADSADTFTPHQIAVNASIARASFPLVQATASAKTGSPGLLYVVPAYYYRLIIT